MPRGGHNVNTGDVFWARVTRSDGCWLWQGRRARGGYGQFDFQGKAWYAHRFAYVLTYGSIPEGMDILHQCDNPQCVRPDHLRPGTHTDNMRDMIAKGRRQNLKGERIGTAKLTWEAVRAIRAEYAAGATQIDIAARYGVDNTSVSLIVRDKTWKEAPDADR